MEGDEGMRGKRATPPGRRRRIPAPVIRAALAVMLLLAAGVWWLFGAGNAAPEVETVVVPWNPGGMTDLTAGALLGASAVDASILNVPGANGANGANRVYNAPRDGKTLVCTSLSAFVTSRQLGFAEWDYTEWEIWLTAYAPYMIAVRDGSPYRTPEDLAEAAGGLICANAGSGTFGFVVSHLFAGETGIDVQHMAYSGSGPAINSVLSGESDFVFAPMSEIAPRSEGLRLLGETGFGEYYGIMAPKGVDESFLRRCDKAWKAAVSEDSFTAFAESAGLIPQKIDREQSALTAEKKASLIGWTLYDTGCVNVSPER